LRTGADERVGEGVEIDAQVESRAEAAQGVLEGCAGGVGVDGTKQNAAVSVRSSWE
jgi:hypothetical protein